MVTNFPDDELISAPDACEVQNISLTTDWRRRDAFPDYPKPIKISGRVYYRMRELRRFIDARAAEKPETRLPEEDRTGICGLDEKVPCA